MKKKKSGWKGNFRLLVFTVLVCVLASEGIIRLFLPIRPVSGDLLTVMVHDDTLGWKGLSNSSKIHTVGGAKLKTRTNEWGFRDDPFPAWEEVKEKQRVIFLGDSYCWGYGIKRNERLSEVIESIDPNIEAYNFGIYGYSTDQELLTLKMYADQIQPHGVVLLFCLNDLLYNDSDVGHRTPKPHFLVEADGKLKLGNVPVPHSSKSLPLIGWIQDNSAICQTATRAITLLQVQSGFKQHRRSAKSNRQKAGDSQNEESEFERYLREQQLKLDEVTRHLLMELRDECERLGASLIVMMVASSNDWTQKHEESPDEAKMVIDWCNSIGIQSIDLFPIFHQHYIETREELYIHDYKDRKHWNGDGNKLAAQVLYPLLQENLADAKH